VKHLGDLLRCVLAVAAALIGTTSVEGARADSYPTQAIRIIVGYEPGGNTDIPARLFGNVISRNLGAPVIVENKPGASGVPAAQYVSPSKPDGYTLLWATSASHSVAVVAMAPLPYDPIKDFAPITLVSMDPNVIVGSLDFPAGSAQSLLDYLKARPRTPIGTIGPATSGRFATELMKAKLGIEMTPVPYKSTGPLLTDMAGGQIPLGIMGESTAVPFLKDKRIKAFVLTSSKPSRILPDLTTLDGIASKGFDAVAWSALYAPPKTPEAIIAKINAAMKEAAQAPEVKKWLDESGLQVPLGTPQELTDFMQADIDKWVKVAKDNHLTFNSGR
jgi:tripartite-type tricarboxylate transporter receptor subunit TctC